MNDVCPICEGGHRASECADVHTDDSWGALRGARRDELREAAAADDEAALRSLLAARALAPLARLLDESVHEVDVLETVNTDDDQRRRLSRSRRLIKALRHVRRRRLTQVETELDEALRVLPDDPATLTAWGYLRVLEDRPEDALERFEAARAVIEEADPDERMTDEERHAALAADAALMAGRCLMVLGRPAEAHARFAALAEADDGEVRAEASYQLARALLAGADGEGSA